HTTLQRDWSSDVCSSDLAASPDTPAATSPAAPNAPASFGGGTPTAQEPNIFGFANISPKADGATGALTQTIRLDVPPGRNGVQRSEERRVGKERRDRRAR